MNSGLSPKWKLHRYYKTRFSHFLKLLTIYFLFYVFTGDLTENPIRFNVIGSLDTDSITSMYEHQIVGVDINHMFLVDGYRNSPNNLTVYQLNQTSKRWVQLWRKLVKYTEPMLKSSPKNRVFYYKNSLFVIPIIEKNSNELLDDFSVSFIR